MADPENTNVQTDDIFDEGGMHDDGTADIIRKALEESSDDDDNDDGGFDQPPVERESDLPDVVNNEDGLDLLDKSRDDEPAKQDKTEVKEDDEAAKKAEEATDDAEGKGYDPAKEGDEKAKVDDDPEAAKAEDDKEDAEGEKASSEGADETKSVDLTTAETSALLEGVPEGHRAEINRRLGDAERVLAPFNAQKEQLDMHGVNAEQAMNRLIELNTFAQTKPDEYIAWVSKEIGGEDPAKALQGAADLLGYKLVKAGEDTDGPIEGEEFLDDTTKEILAENRRLKAEQATQNTKSFGPDTPERTQARDAQNVLTDFNARS